MLKTIDAILLLVWEVFCACLQVVVVLIAGVFKILKGFFGLLGKFDFFANFANSSFISYWREAQWPIDLVENIKNWFLRLSEKMKTAKFFRRCVFLAVLLLGILYSYPPSHWGPWRLYQTGVASYYSEGFWFKKTANGERFVPLFYTAAHKSLPFGITVKVKNLENGKIVYVKINDRGPFVKGRIIDLSSAAAKKIGVFEPGTAKVDIYTKRKY